MACMGACTSPPKDSTVLLLLLPLPAITAAVAAGGSSGREGEVGLRLGAAVLARGGVVGPGGLLRRVVRAEPDSALLDGGRGSPPPYRPHGRFLTPRKCCWPWPVPPMPSAERGGRSRRCHRLIRGGQEEALIGGGGNGGGVERRFECLTVRPAPPVPLVFSVADLR
ncbi:hypothetical protein GUJ93_ZPchr0013g37768 [Zizania palustris]|uniref:Uncharacterized protein n=1 Tax=Zizania palustris TaxID=103762 RepID=A0A8J5WQK0_ZIZPA|nr:hypothetical protein GUJ93_ZPchr0013g37768 [Zizania palustris]